MVNEISKERKSLTRSMRDVDSAIRKLDDVLVIVVFIAMILIFIAFLNTNFGTTLATAGTALLSLSFIFATTCQEILASILFLFHKVLPPIFWYVLTCSTHLTWATGSISAEVATSSKNFPSCSPYLNVLTEQSCKSTMLFSIPFGSTISHVRQRSRKWFKSKSISGRVLLQFNV